MCFQADFDIWQPSASGGVAGASQAGPHKPIYATQPVFLLRGWISSFSEHVSADVSKQDQSLRLSFSRKSEQFGMSTQQVEMLKTTESILEVPNGLKNAGDVLGNGDLFNNNPLENELFDATILNAVELKKGAPELPPYLRVRPLHLEDYDNGYLKLLEQLTVVGTISELDFQERFRSMRSANPPMYYVVVLENIDTRRIVGAATLVIEFKFIHGAGTRGRVEDVVVDKELRGKKLGQLLNFYLVEMARLLGVYKLSLECKDKLITFYEQFGYIKDPGNNFMVQRFDYSKI